MPRVLCSALPTAPQRSGSVTVEGWIHRRRQLATVTFVVLRDRSGLAQVVVTDPQVREQVSQLPEETVVRVTGTPTANSKAAAAVEKVGVELPVVPERIPVIHFREALELVGAPADEPDLAPEHERALGAWAKTRFDSDFLAVEGYPAAKRPFYTHPQPDDPRWTNSFDLLFRSLELVTGGQRLHKHADYLAAMAARGEDPAGYGAYLEAMRYGMPPHGGFAIGLARWTSRLLRTDNIRHATLFPRDLHRLHP